MGEKLLHPKIKKLGIKKTNGATSGLPGGFAAGGEHPRDEPADAGESSECRLQRRSPLMG